MNEDDLKIDLDKMDEYLRFLNLKTVNVEVQALKKLVKLARKGIQDSEKLSILIEDTENGVKQVLYELDDPVSYRKFIQVLDKAKEK